MSDNNNSGPNSTSPASGAPVPAAPSTWWARLRAALMPWGLGIGAAAGALTGIYAYWSAHQDYMRRFGSVDGGGTEARAAWGQYGDYLGGTVNPTLGLLTLLALVATVWLQMRQLALSRQALHKAQQEVCAAAIDRAKAAKLQTDLVQATQVATEYQVLAQAFAALTQQRETIEESIQAAPHLPSDAQGLHEERERLNRLCPQLKVALQDAAEELLARRAGRAASRSKVAST